MYSVSHWIHTVLCTPFFDKGDNFPVSLFPFLYTNPLLKGVYPKRKEFAPKGSKFFPFRVDPFSEAMGSRGLHLSAETFRGLILNNWTLPGRSMPHLKQVHWLGPLSSLSHSSIIAPSLWEMTQHDWNVDRVVNLSLKSDTFLEGRQKITDWVASPETVLTLHTG